MSECSDITKAIQDLSNKIHSYKKDLDEKFNKLNKRIDSLESQFKGLDARVNALDQDIKNIISRVNDHTKRIVKLERLIFSGTKLNEDENFRLRQILKQLQKLKKDVAAIEKYINSLDNAGKKIVDVLTSVVSSIFNL